MLHIILTSETLLTNQHLFQYTAAAVSVTTTDFAVNAAAASIIAVTAAAVYVASTIAAVLNVAVAFTVIAAIVIVIAAVSIASTATAAVSVSSASASNRSPHSVNSVRLWSYHPLAPFPQSVTNIWMETDRVGDAGGKGGNSKKNRPSQDPHRLNSDKRVERQDRLHISI
jgi:hypothetical protein